MPHFPLLTARLDRGPATDRPFFVTGRGGAGALVVEATVPAALSDHLPLSPSPERVRLYAPLPEDTPHMLQVQVNRFDCGGLVIGPSTHHGAADGYSTITFLRAWADTVRANGVPPLDRVARCAASSSTAAPSSCPRRRTGTASSGPVSLTPSSKLPRSPTWCCTTRASSVEKLKASVEPKYTKFETLSAHIWKKITVARGRVDDDRRTTIQVTVNGRPRLGADALAKGFFGNVVLPGTSARDVAGASCADVAALVRKGIRAVDAQYFQLFIDFGALHGGEELEAASLGEDNELSPDVTVDSGMHLEMHRLDFGCGGRQAGILPTRVPGDGVVIWEKHAKVLKNIAYTLRRA